MISYSFEKKLAGTGFRESSFQSVFDHPEFEKVLDYIYPEMSGQEPYNFEDENILRGFCIGIFNFKIPSYKEAVPIRLVSYFYPNLFLPIFKLNHLQEISNAFGFKTDAVTNGDRLFYYNSLLLSKMKNLPFENIVKQNIATQVKYTVELQKRLKIETFESILKSYKKKWINDFLSNGYEILKEISKKKYINFQ